ncbi:hypothetical protein P7K49_020425, partial [Saguinus oedipus]
LPRCGGGGHLGGGAMSGSNSKAAAAASAAGPGGLVAGKEEKKKAGGGVLNRLKARRQAPHHAADDGQELLALDTIRPEHVLRLSRVTESECRAGRALPSRRAPAPGAFRRPDRSTGAGAALPAAPPAVVCPRHAHVALDAPQPVGSPEGPGQLNRTLLSRPGAEARSPTCFLRPGPVAACRASLPLWVRSLAP